MAQTVARCAARALVLICVPLLGGCTLYPDRGPVADFFLKDYDLPAYEPGTAAFHRDRVKVQPGDATGALGGMAGAFAGGRIKAWRASASGGMGGMAGATMGQAFTYAEHADPLPETYEVLALALPIIATDPNQGPTFGILPVAVFQEGLKITNILAPDLTFNEIDGVGGTFRMLRFFSTVSTLDLNAGSWSEGAHDYTINYKQRRVGPNEFLSYRAYFTYRTVLSPRFYGIGNETKDEAETSYVFRQTEALAELSFELPLNVDFDLQERISSYKVGPGRLEDIPSARANFPQVSGIKEGRLTILTHRVRLTYDSRDSRAAPTEGILGQFTYEISDDALGSETGFQRFGLTLTFLIPKFDKRATTVIHMGGWIMTGTDIPFYELTQVGGKSTNRGYGAARFLDKHGYIINLEERVNVLEFNMAGVDQIVQLAGFVDIGRVFSDSDAVTLKDSKVSAGGSVRLIIPDSDLVTSIDIGFSDEGSAVFVGLDYPF